MQRIAEATQVHIKHHIFVQKEKDMLLIQVMHTEEIKSNILYKMFSKI